MSDGSRTRIRRRAFPEGVSHPLASPIQPSVAYVSASPDELDRQYEGEVKGYTYAREGHPNAEALAARIDEMEGAAGGIITGSGMAAVSAALFGLLKAGDHVIGGNRLYGRSLKLLGETLPRLGITSSLVDVTDASAVAGALRDETRMILVEVVSNPTLRVADMSTLARIAHDRDLLLLVDNTFTTPRAYRPFEHGADVVIHSLTKLLAGHSDVTLGYVAAKAPGRAEALRDAATTMGLTASPFDCWLAERGLFTFDLRHERAEANAAALADHLAGLAGVESVLYPGRADHPDHARAVVLFGGHFGNMVSFTLKGGRTAANALIRAAPEIAFAPTLGDIGTTLSHPASSSHRALAPEERARLAISEGVFRISVGVEDIELLKADFSRAIAAAAKVA